MFAWVYVFARAQASELHVLPCMHPGPCMCVRVYLCMDVCNCLGTAQRYAANINAKVTPVGSALGFWVKEGWDRLFIFICDMLLK
jgi:hypothetical protein